MRRQSSTAVIFRALLVSALAAGPVATANADAVPNMFWTSVGSAGTVDEADRDAVSLDGAVASHVGAFGRTVRIRYNVVAVDGLSGGGITLVGNYLDTGAGSRVILSLKRYSVDSDVTDVLLVLDSNDPLFPPSWSFQTRQVQTCEGGFDFTRHAYFIEAQLIRQATSPPTASLAQLAAVQVSTGHVC